MLRHPTHKTIRFDFGSFWGGETYKIKALRPVDFIGTPEGFPLCFFSSIQTEKTKYEQTMEAAGIGTSNEANLENQLKTLKFVLKSGVISCNKIAFNVDEFLQRPATLSNNKKALCLFFEILKLTFKAFLGETKITQSSAITAYIMAKKFGKTPIEVILPLGGYSETDAYMFNVYVTNLGLKEEDRIARKAASKR